MYSLAPAFCPPLKVVRFFAPSKACSLTLARSLLMTISVIWLSGKANRSMVVMLSERVSLVSLLPWKAFSLIVVTLAKLLVKKSLPVKPDGQRIKSCRSLLNKNPSMAEKELLLAGTTNSISFGQFEVADTAMEATLDPNLKVFSSAQFSKASFWISTTPSGITTSTR